MNFKYRSVAEWPHCGKTTDSHYSEESAEAVCRLLQREGYGGDRKIFPIKTYTEPIKEG